MYFDEFNAVCNAAKGKINFMENNTFGYLPSLQGFSLPLEVL